MRTSERFKNIVSPLALLVFLIASGLSVCRSYMGGDAPGLFVAALWSALLLVALITHLSIRRWNTRFESGHCPVCNYDLRATPDRCPECGHELSASEIPLPRWLAGNALNLHRSNQSKRF